MKREDEKECVSGTLNIKKIPKQRNFFFLKKINGCPF
jgi:hypothetical protein